MDTSLVALITAAISLITIIAKAIIDWRARVAAADAKKAEELAAEQRITDSVFDRVTQRLRKDNDQVQKGEDEIDKILNNAPPKNA